MGDEQSKQQESNTDSGNKEDNRTIGQKMFDEHLENVRFESRGI